MNFRIGKAVLTNNPFNKIDKAVHVLTGSHTGALALVARSALLLL